MKFDRELRERFKTRCEKVLKALDQSRLGREADAKLAASDDDLWGYESSGGYFVYYFRYQNQIRDCDYLREHLNAVKAFVEQHLTTLGIKTSDYQADWDDFEAGMNQIRLEFLEIAQDMKNSRVVEALEAQETSLKAIEEKLGQVSLHKLEPLERDVRQLKCDVVIIKDEVAKIPKEAPGAKTEDHMGRGMFGRK